MTSRRAIAAFVAFALLAVGFLVWKERHPVAEDRSTDAPAAASSRMAPPAGPGSRSEPLSAATAERSTLADPLNSPATDIRADLRLVSDILETFRSNFPSTGNPTGTNAEITATLTGKNRLHLALIPSDHVAINRESELCDRWGTPFFFHAESATKMEIRSAGPDRKLWTADDVTFAP